MNNKETTIAEKISPILCEIENIMWEWEFNHQGEKPNYKNDAFRASIKIFMSILLDKMYDYQDSINMEQKYRETKAEYFGKEIKELVLLATGIDTHELYK